MTNLQQTRSFHIKTIYCLKLSFYFRTRSLRGRFVLVNLCLNMPMHMYHTCTLATIVSVLTVDFHNTPCVQVRVVAPLPVLAHLLFIATRMK